ncbi:MAG: CvpA family protein [Muribaculaceae bacterium]|nr:CvpA family protein [Muribaculaceae bacterium]MDE5929701.1 CvpA family protein [Muribaculaceae bacterium]
MNAFDILLVVLLAAAALRGYFKGIIAMAASVVGVVAGVAACRLLAHEVAGWFGTEATDLIVANVLIFVVVYLGCFLLGRLLHSLFRALRLTIVNRLCGAAFCVAGVALALSLLMNLWHLASPTTAPASASTEGLRGIIYNVAPALLGYLN